MNSLMLSSPIARSRRELAIGEERIKIWVDIAEKYRVKVSKFEVGFLNDSLCKLRLIRSRRYEIKIEFCKFSLLAGEL